MGHHISLTMDRLHRLRPSDIARLKRALSEDGKLENEISSLIASYLIEIEWPAAIAQDDVTRIVLQLRKAGLWERVRPETFLSLIQTKARGEVINAFCNALGLDAPSVDATKVDALGASDITPLPSTRVEHSIGGVRSAGISAEAESAEDNTLQLAEEFLNVGKRAVRGGTTRIRRYTVEKPVEENVSLHNERVVLDRRPVTEGRVLANADFTDKTISMTEMNEEVVVSKTARIVEEIGLRKEASDRVETVRDTLRKDDVEVEKVSTIDRFEIGSGRSTPVVRKI